MKIAMYPPAYYVTLWLIAGFLIGSIPFGWIVAKLGGINIREHGSGNIGMTNVWRVMGWKAGVTVLVLDTLKGFVPVWLCNLLFLKIPREMGLAGENVEILPDTVSLVVMGVGLMAVLGHTFTPWLRFQGGKGVATGLGVIIALMQLWVLIPLGVFGVTLAITRYVSLSSILGVFAAPVVCLSVPQLRQYAAFAILAAVVIIAAHRSNIKRLIDGTEVKVGRRKAPTT